MPGPARACVVLAMSAAVLLTGCGAGSGGPPAAKAKGKASPSASATPTKAAPAFVPARAGQCWNATVAQSAVVSWEGSGAVACTAKHNAVTYAVATLPEDPSFGAAGGQAMPAAIAKSICNFRKAQAYVGHSLKSPVRLSIFWYRPTPAQYLAGARQMRCDLSVVEGKVFRALPSRRTAAAFNGKAFHICSTGSHKAGPKKGAAAYAPCTRSSTYRLLRYVELKTGPNEPFPGTKVLSRRTHNGCSVLSDGDVVEFPSTAKGWARGDTLGRCWHWLG